MSPLVTVVTSTWQRPKTVVECAIQSVNFQTYPEIQHIVVIDGCDKATVRALEAAEYTTEAFYHIGQQEYEPNQRRYVELGRNWSEYSGDGGFGAVCRLTGAWMGAGEFISYLDDDAYYEPSHVAEMVAEFDEDTMFVTTACHGNGVPCTPGPPPGLNRTDTSAIMHRAIVLRDAGGFHTDGYTSDGNMVERWLAKGLTWKFKDSLTVSHPSGHNSGRPMPLCGPGSRYGACAARQSTSVPAAGWTLPPRSGKFLWACSGTAGKSSEQVTGGGHCHLPRRLHEPLAGRLAA